MKKTSTTTVFCYTGGPLLKLFFETQEKTCLSRKPCKQRSDLVLNVQMRIPK